MGIKYDLSNAEYLQNFLDHVGQMRLAGKRPVVQFVQEGKTDRQRRYQWGWFYPQACEALSAAGIAIPMDDGTRYPYDSIILHEILKEQVLRPLYREWGRKESITAKGGSRLDLPVSTEKDNDGKVIDLPEFALYIKKCREWIYSRWEIAVPDPQDGYYADIAKSLKL
ncbi:hypothetical protein [Litorivivens sp.]|uniref:hypothetical protein n=1 Tax=Litorivivens sp. TaxID=2020868 RepID=UPI00356255B9